MVLLETNFPGRVIFGLAINIAHQDHLTPMDVFLWDYVKEKVFANKPQTVEHLKEKIRRAVGELQPNLCEIVIRNFNKRITLF